MQEDKDLTTGKADASDFREATISQMLKEGTALHQAGKWKEANMVYQAILELEPSQPDAYHLLGVLDLQNGQVASAIQQIEKAISINLNNPEYFNNLGSAYQENEQFRRAEAAFLKAIELKVSYAEAYFNLGNLYQRTHETIKAINAYEEALTINPSYISALLNLGVLYFQQLQLDKAESLFLKADKLSPKNANIGYNLAAVYHARGKYFQAKHLFTNLIQKADKLSRADLNNNLGSSSIALGEYEQALTFLKASLDDNPNLLDAEFNLALCYYAMNRLEDALNHFKRLIHNSTPNWPFLASTYSYCANIFMCLCDWEQAKSYTEKLVSLTEVLWAKNCSVPLDPFTVISLPCSRVFKSKVSEFKAYQCSQGRKIDLSHIEKEEKSILKIGYISPDFNRHPVGLLIQDLFKYHDREQFHITAFTLSAFQDDITERIKGSVDEYIDLSQMAYYDAAQEITDHGIDILIDLAGYTRHSRPEILSYQPAPIQCHFLGYTLSLGADYIQYFITQTGLMPSHYQSMYHESFVYLPNFMATRSDLIETSNQSHTKSSLGLPEDKFIFCSLSETYRIDEQTFDVWVSILTQTIDSVLWIYVPSQKAQQSLLRYAEDRGIAPERFVFSNTNMITEDGRHAYADLWLDTLGISSATTVYLSAMVGLPVLTLEGDTPLARTASGINRSLELMDLIAYTESEYIAKAVEYYHSPNILEEVKSFLKENMSELPAFNQKGFVIDLEKAFQKMWDNFIQSKRPSKIQVES